MSTINTNPEFDDIYYGYNSPETDVPKPVEGDYYFNILDHDGYVYDGSKWIFVEDEHQKQKVFQLINIRKGSSVAEDYDRAMKPLRDR